MFMPIYVLHNLKFLMDGKTSVYCNFSESGQDLVIKWCFITKRGPREGTIYIYICRRTHISMHFFSPGTNHPSMTGGPWFDALWNLSDNDVHKRNKEISSEGVFFFFGSNESWHFLDHGLRYATKNTEKELFTCLVSQICTWIDSFGANARQGIR